MIKIDQCSINNYIIIWWMKLLYTPLSKLCIVHTVYRLTALIQNDVRLQVYILTAAPNHPIRFQILFYCIVSTICIMFIIVCGVMAALCWTASVKMFECFEMVLWGKKPDLIFTEVLSRTFWDWVICTDRLNPHTHRLAGKVNTLHTEVKWIQLGAVHPPDPFNIALPTRKYPCVHTHMGQSYYAVFSCLLHICLNILVKILN